MPQSLIRAGFTAAGGLGALLSLLAADADASGPAILHNWVNIAGGSFHTATNWNPLGEPGPLDTAVFDVGTQYTVTFSQSATNKLLIIDDVDVTFDLPPFAVYALNGVVIGDNDALTPGRLRLTNGIVSVQPLPPPPPPNPPPPPLMVRIGKDIGISDFLELCYDDQMACYHEGRTRHEPGLSAKAAWLGPTPGLRDWRRQMQERDVELFEAIAGDALSEAGYERACRRISPAIEAVADRCRRWWAAHMPGRPAAGRRQPA